MTIHLGDCLEILPLLDADSVDSCVTDPPYHLTSIVKRFGAKGAAEAKSGATGAFKRVSAGFMGQEWDGGDIAFRPEVWAEVLRVLKPGGYLLAFASTRGFGRMAVAIEDAGFVTHPLIAWVFGQGMPKATRVKAEGYEDFRYGGQALKPALEPIFVGQKPFSEKSGTANILRHGTGALNIGACRVPAGDDELGRWPANLIHDGSDVVLAAFPDAKGQQGEVRGDEPSEPFGANTYGRMKTRLASAKRIETEKSAARFFYCSKTSPADRNDGLAGAIVTIEGDAEWAHEVQPVRLLVDTEQSPPQVTAVSGAPESDATAWSTMLFGSGTTVRFPKGSTSITGTKTNSTTISTIWSLLENWITNASIQGARCETESGGSPVEIAETGTKLVTITCAKTASLLGVDPAALPMQLRINVSENRSGHPTVKPTDLMRYLCRLVTPPGGTVLDPFAGSGSTGRGAVLEGFNFIGIEMLPEYVAIAEARIAAAERRYADEVFV